MLSLRSRIIRALIVERVMRRVVNLDHKTIDEYRRQYAALTRRQILPRGTRVERATIDGLSFEWVRARSVPAVDERTILYFHGGGYVSGSCAAHRDMAARISAACGVRLLVLDYRLAPEHKYPAANEDALRAFRWLRESGIRAEKIVLAGDSAGGGLALATLLALRDAGEELPRAAFLLSPWLSPLTDGESYRTRAEADPFITVEFVRACAEALLGGTEKDPSELVLFEQDLSGLPNMLVQVGDDELLLSDSMRLAERAQTAGVKLRLDVWQGMWHVFQAFAVILPEAKRALADIGGFVREQLGPGGNA